MTTSCINPMARLDQLPIDTGQQQFLLRHHQFWLVVSANIARACGQTQR
jgi:hypothetical protein